MWNQILIDKTALSETRRTSAELPARLADGEALIEVEQFALTANNISYAATGDALGYWSFFPADEGWGRLPVWGFGRVAASQADALPVGERVFGFLPMSSHLVVRPDSASALCFSDATAHRAGLHPWYNRYYRCANDPVFSEGRAETQPVLWALFMTGWMLARELAATVDRVYVSSASSKTALSLAWSLAQLDSKTPCVGITSERNRAFVEGLGVYAEVQTYDSLSAEGAPARTAYVDIAGNAAATSSAHVALGDRLVDSVLVGSTHRAPSAEPLPMPGPGPRFFFIPGVAEERAAAEGLAAYHQQFSEAWHPFAEWAAGWLEVDRGAGPDAIEATYKRVEGSGLEPERAVLLSWS